MISLKNNHSLLWLGCWEVRPPSEDHSVFIGGVLRPLAVCVCTAEHLSLSGLI